jgi:hypothetical protein
LIFVLCVGLGTGGDAQSRQQAALPPEGKIDWRQISGNARDITVSGDGRVYAVDPRGNVWHMHVSEKQWSRFSGRLTRIAATTKGRLIGVDHLNRIFMYNGVKWSRMQGAAIDVSANARGQIAAVGPSGDVLLWQARNFRWRRVSGAPAAIRVSIGPDGTLWVVARSGSLHRKTESSKWRRIPGTGQDVTVAAAGTVLLSSNKSDAKYWDHKTRRWRRFAPSSRTVAIDRDGRVWRVDAKGAVYTGRSRLPSSARSSQRIRTASSTPVFRVAAVKWTPVPGKAADIGAGPNGTVFAADPDGRVWRWDAARGAWSSFPGKLVRVAVAPDGNPWGVDNQGRLYRHDGRKWTLEKFRARDIAIGPDGAAFAVTQKGQVLRRDPKTRRWSELGTPIAANRIAVDVTGRPWVVTRSGGILRRGKSTWENLQGRAIDIAAGELNAIFIAGQDERLYRWSEGQKKWNALIGNSVAVTVAFGRRPWIAARNGLINAEKPVEKTKPSVTVATTKSGRKTLGSSEPLPTSRKPIVLEKVPGAGRDIGIGSDGSIFIVGFEGNVQRWSNGSRRFLNFPGQLARIAVDSTGNPWGVDLQDRIFRHDGTRYIQVEGTATDISIGGDGSVFAVSPTDRILRFNPDNDRFDEILGPTTASRIAVDPRGRPWIVQPDGEILQFNGKEFVRTPLLGRDIGVGPDGSVIMLRKEDGAAFRFNFRSRDWERLNGVGVAVSVGPKGRPWIVNAEGEVFASDFFKRDESRDAAIAQGTLQTDESPSTVFTFTLGQSFKSITSPAAILTDIAIGSSGLVAITDTGGSLYRFNAKTQTFAPPVSADFGKIAIAPNDTIWAVNFDFDISSVDTNNNFSPVIFGPFESISVGADGSIFAVGSDNRLYTIDPVANTATLSSIQFTGNEKFVAVDSTGSLWIIDTSSRIYQLVEGKFVLRPGKAKDIAIGANGSVYRIDTSDRLFRWNPINKNWDRIRKNADHVAVGPTGRPWVIESDKVFRAK